MFLQRGKVRSVGGYLYACEWLEDAEYGTMVTVSSRTRSLWMPDDGILIQWVYPDGKIQVSLPEKFPPTPREARVAFLGDRTVPHAVIREVRRYLEQQERRDRKEETIQLAPDLITEGAIRSEGRLQAVASKLFHREKPAAEPRVTR